MSTATDTAVAVLVPLLARPHRVEPVWTSIHAATPDAHVVFLCSPDDRDVIAAVREVTDPFVVPWPPGDGDYARKINLGFRETTEPWVFLGADDLAFRPGWLAAALAEAGDGIGVIGTNDLGNRRVIAGRHATHSLVARWYGELGTIDEPGKVLHEGYAHEFVDDELVATAQHRRAWRFAAESIVEHLHPNWKHADGTPKAPMDALYAQQADRMARSRDLFVARCRLWT